MPNYPIGFEPVGTVALLTNPRSGRGSARHATELALEVFDKRGVNAIAFNATSPEDTGRILQRALADLDFDAIAVCGGDGMLNKVLQETANTGIPIGIVPAGSGNDTGRHLRIPFDPAAAADVIADGFVTTTDLGLITNEAGQSMWFASVLSCGQDAYWTARASEYNWVRGPSKFHVAILEGLARFQSHKFRIELEGVHTLPHLSTEDRLRMEVRDGVVEEGGKLVLERTMYFASFGNTRSYGAGKIICPQADHHDGLLDLTIIEDEAIVPGIFQAPAFVRGDHANIPWVTSYQCQRATVFSDVDIPAHGDGEPMLVNPFTVEAVPAAGRFIVPAP
ncbi:diacylglycerol/lipid kinase family protein [Corynebacterium choanae]|uniref:Diacylglycerol kinase n=1 Tax=Corynebacterium choanae TaxID=1862358 RepID=A0A3G6J7R3_9CORY|nr:diacylglycerol kinase family protein [Corynebacterium choanae]AZA14097.1 Diacylglycerol kinase [Corynebacterium choanae]